MLKSSTILSAALLLLSPAWGIEKNDPLSNVRCRNNRPTELQSRPSAVDSAEQGIRRNPHHLRHGARWEWRMGGCRRSSRAASSRARGRAPSFHDGQAENIPQVIKYFGHQKHDSRTFFGAL